MIHFLLKMLVFLKLSILGPKRQCSLLEFEIKFLRPLRHLRWISTLLLVIKILYCLTIILITVGAQNPKAPN